MFVKEVKVFNFQFQGGVDEGAILLFFLIQKLKSLCVEANKFCCYNGMRN
jgi:hypothetical protein